MKIIFNKNIIIIFSIVLTIISCNKKKEGLLIVKKAKLTNGSKKLLDIFLKTNNLNPNTDEIEFYIPYQSDFLILEAREKYDFIGDFGKREDFYMLNYKGFRITFNMNLNEALFRYKGEWFKEKILLSKIIYDIDGPPPINSKFPLWELTIKNNEIIQFNYQFCTLTESQIKEIESIKFGSVVN